MNKYLAWLPALMVLGTVMYKPVKEATQPKLVNKNVSLSVFKGSDYTSGVYNNTSAQVHIIIEKVNQKGVHTIVWDKTMDAKSLSDYPSVKNALQHNITVTNINQKKEYLVVDYTLIYNSNGSQLYMHDAEIVNHDHEKVDISI
jgi:hypothetical protein